MSRAVYALLVGIDEYTSPVPPLKGCVNDITAAERYLRDRYSGQANALDIVSLTNASATRDAVIDAFRRQLGRAGADDTALFYFSGHGSQQPCAPELLYLEPDGMDETLVCYDSRLPDQYDLADKELAGLIHEVAARGAHVVVILDCCHSGSGTRALETAVRRAPTDDRPRPLGSYIVDPRQPTRATRRDAPSSTSGWAQLPEGKHLLLAACRADERAQEIPLGGMRRGVFSYYLLDALARARGAQTYGSIFRRVKALVEQKVSSQSPEIEWSDPDELNQPFLGGAAVAEEPYFVLKYDAELGWVIDGGAVHGIQPVDGAETTTLAIHPFDTRMDARRETKALATARVFEVQPHVSRVDIDVADGELDETQTYVAVVIGVPLPLLGVVIDGDDAGIQAARQALATAGPDGGASIHVRLASDAATAELRIHAEGGRYTITRATGDRPLVGDVSGYDADGALRAIRRVEHIARWTTIARLSNPGSGIAPDEIQLEVHRVVGTPVTRSSVNVPTELVPSGRELRFEYEYRDGKWQPPSFKIKLRNGGDQPLWCALLTLSESFEVNAKGLLSAGRVRLEPGQEVWVKQGQPISTGVPEPLWRAGVTERRDVVKLIASNRDFNPSLLEQEKLDTPRTAGAKRAIPGRSSLDRLMARADTREFLDSDSSFADWVTSELSITTVRPLDSVALADGRAIEVTTGVTLEPPAGFRARARLTTVSDGGRDLGNALVPPILRDAAVSEPFGFSTARGSDPGLTILELIDVDDHTVVTREAPLTVVIDVGDERDLPTAGDATAAHVLAVAFDGEFYLPLGHATSGDGTVRVTLDRLPAPVASDRSLSGSIRILLHKVVSKVLGTPYEYPLLTVADIALDGTVTYVKDPAAVRARVAEAGRVLLYVHGIIGDTRVMAASGYTPNAVGILGVPPLADRYDLILAFDYENVQTSIQDTARTLGKRLSDVGLGAGHGKTLHVIAHSMGGLVSRWFIEREGGRAVVQRLVTVGTPNDGSPWPKVEDVATALLSLALNGIGAWPATVLGALVSGVERVDVTLDSMQPGSELLKTLWASDDPGVPYTLISGNTTLIANVATGDNRVARLLSRVLSPSALHRVAGLAFFGEPNDIAVRVESGHRVPMTRTPRPVVVEVASDHLSYFRDPAVLRALADALPGGATAEAVS
jgi:hypothetical protein